MKILLLTQNVQDKVSLTQGIENVTKKAKSIGLDLTFVTRETTKKFTGTTFDNTAIGKGACIKPEEILAEVDGKYDVACLIYDWTFIKPQPTNPVQSWVTKDGCTPIQIPVQWYTDTTVTPIKTFVEVFEQFFFHELAHAFFYLTGRGAQDSVHEQYKSSVYQQKLPVEYYLFLIKGLLPFFKTNAVEATTAPQNTPDVVITRVKDNGVQTMGKLVAKNGSATFTCDVLELPWKNNLPDVSCIPKGLYDVKYTFSLRFKKFMYEITKVPNRSGIRQHSGNYYTDIQGCQLLGTTPQDINKDGQIDVLNSHATVSAFEGFMGKKNYKLLIN